MRISELIHELNELADRQGDLEVVVNYDVAEFMSDNLEKVYTPERVVAHSPKRPNGQVSDLTYALIE